MPTNGNDHDPEARRKYINAFNSTMQKIWLEKITLLKIYDTGLLYRSVQSFSGYHTRTNADASDIQLQQQWRTHGLWQNYGVGRETPRGNTGDIGRPKVRKKRKWFDPKYFASVYNLRDFICESFAQQYLAIFTNAFSDRNLRAQASAPQPTAPNLPF